MNENKISEANLEIIRRLNGGFEMNERKYRTRYVDPDREHFTDVHDEPGGLGRGV